MPVPFDDKPLTLAVGDVARAVATLVKQDGVRAEDMRQTHTNREARITVADEPAIAIPRE